MVTTVPATSLIVYNAVGLDFARPDLGFGLIRLSSLIIWRISATLWLIGLIATIIAFAAAIMFTSPKLQRIVYGMSVGIVIGLVSLLTTCTAIY